MHLHEMEHVLRASKGATGEREFVIIGSQAVLAGFPDAPRFLTYSDELDIYPLNAPEKSDLIDGSIGERSQFHDTFGYYAHGVGLIVFPRWILRIQNLPRGARKILPTWVN